MFTKEQNELSAETLRTLEGFSEKAYIDATGHSIGYGHFIQAGEDRLLTATITKDEADKMLHKDLVEHQAGITKWLKKPVSDLKLAALTSLAYNTGAYSSAVRQVIRLYNDGKEAEASRVFEKYNKSRDPKTGKLELNPTLVKRRELERQMFTAAGPFDVKAAYAQIYKIDDKELASRGVPRNFTTDAMIPRQRPGSTAPMVGPASEEKAANENQRVLAELVRLNQRLGQQSNEIDYMNRLRAEGRNI